MTSVAFYKELFSTLEIDETDEDNCCLITDEPLTEHSVELDCGHKFNYIPLYHDVANHKQKFNNMESNVGTLKINELRCPYCRDKHNNVLPYYETLKLPKVNGVNAIFKYKRCAYLLPNPNYMPDEPIDGLLNYKMLNCKCQGLVDQDVDYYCDKHKKTLTKDKKKQELIKKKDNQIFCEETLKSGPRKGEKCNLVASIDKCCKRHQKKVL